MPLRHCPDATLRIQPPRIRAPLAAAPSSPPSTLLVALLAPLRSALPRRIGAHRHTSAELGRSRAVALLNSERTDARPRRAGR